MSTFEIGLFNTSYNATETLNLAYPSDSYSFTLNDSHSLKLSLTDISASVNWQLKNAEGTTLGLGAVSPTDLEAINLYDLQAGVYFLEVSQTSGDTDYSLNVDSLTNFQVESGFFAVGHTAQVGGDNLIRGGADPNESIVSRFTGVKTAAPDSEGFIHEVARNSRKKEATKSLAEKMNTPPRLQLNLNSAYKLGESINLNDTQVFDPDGDLDKITIKITKNNKIISQKIIKATDINYEEDLAKLNYDWMPVEPGKYKLNVIAVDKSKQKDEVNKSFTVLKKSTIPKNIPPKSLQFNLLPSYTSDQSVNLTDAKVFDKNGASDLKEVRFQLYKNGTKWGDGTSVSITPDSQNGEGWGTFNHSWSDLPTGEYRLKARASDGEKWSNTVVKKFSITSKIVEQEPNSAPQDLQFNLLPIYTIVEEKVRFSGAKVYDPDGVEDLKKIDFWLQHPDGQWVDIPDTEQFTTDSQGRARFSYDYDLSGLAPGRYQLRAIAEDNAGNTSPAAIQSFSVITGIGLSEEVKLAAAEAANLDSYDPQALAETREWIVWVSPGQSASELAQSLEAENLGFTGIIPHTYVWKFPDNIAPKDVANLLKTTEGVEFAYPQVPVELQLLHQPTDSLFEEQWNLTNTNVPQAWNISSPTTSQTVRGRDVVIGIVDDGIAYDHPDLQSRYNADLSWDFSDDDSDPAPQSDQIFNADLSQSTVKRSEITFKQRVNLTGMVSDLNVTLDVNMLLDPGLPNPTDLDIFLYSPDNSEFEDPGSGRTSTRSWWWPGREDLKFQQKVQLHIQPDGSIEFDPNKLVGAYAGGTWTLEIENPDPNTYKKPKMEQLSEQILNSWSLQIKTLNPHGTAVAGIAGAAEEGKGIVGVAPQAELAGLRLLGNIDPFTGTYPSKDLSIANALYQSDRNESIDIFNNSWGPRLMNRQPLALAALEKGSQSGRNTLGNSYVFAAGNDGYWGGNVNYNSFANSRHAIAVAAVDNQGIHSSYSTPGASVFISAPSDNGQAEDDFVGIYTTSITKKSGYADDFGGTSATAPLVSGAIALMLEANPNLTARDVQHILVKTAQPTDVIKDSQGNIQAGNGWTKNQAGYWFNDKYGFGVIDAAKAVSTAADWTNVKAENKIESAVQGVNDEIPNGNNTGALDPSVIKINQDLTVETVEVLLDIDHQNWADLTVVLTSPDGTQSVLAKSISGDILPLHPEDNGFNIKNWKFTSVRHWGESSKGEWKLQVFDEKGNEFKGDWNTWKLNIYGTNTLDDIVVNQNHWNAKFINRTSENVADYANYNFSEPDAVVDLGPQLTGEGIISLKKAFGSPAANIQEDYFAMEASTRTQLEAGKPYQITTQSDDGIRFLLRKTGTQEWTELGNDWRDRSVGAPAKNIYFQVPETEEYDFQIVYYEKTQGAVVDVVVQEAPPISTDSWVGQLGTSSDDRSRAMTVDSDGNVYIAGLTFSSLDGNVNGSGVNVQQADPFITKYDPTGNKLWTRQLGSSGYDYYNAITADSMGNTYTVGYDDGPGTVFGAVTLTKWDSNGSKVWQQFFDTPTQDSATGVITDSDGNVYITGKTNNSNGDADAFTAKYDSNGNQIWTRKLGTLGQDQARSIATDGSSNLYIAGVTEGSLDGNINAGGTDVFLTKYDLQGNKIWTRQLGSAASEGYVSKQGNGEFIRNVSVAVDNSGNAYVSSSTEGSLDGNTSAGGRDAFVTRYDTNGNKLWTRQMGTEGDDRAWGVAVDSIGKVYVTGYTSGSLDGQTNLGNLDAFVTEYDINGNKLATRLLGTSAEDISTDIVVDRIGNVYISGQTKGSLGGSSAGGDDAWVSKNYGKRT